MMDIKSLMERQEKQRILDARINTDEPAGCTGINPAQCYGCLNSNGEPPFADGPQKRYCLAFARSEGMPKPPGVYYDGLPCEFRRTYA